MRPRILACAIGRNNFLAPRRVTMKLIYIQFFKSIIKKIRYSPLDLDCLLRAFDFHVWLKNKTFSNLATNLKEYYDNEDKCINDIENFGCFFRKTLMGIIRTTWISQKMWITKGIQRMVGTLIVKEHPLSFISSPTRPVCGMVVPLTAIWHLVLRNLHQIGGVDFN